MLRVVGVIVWVEYCEVEERGMLGFGMIGGSMGGEDTCIRKQRRFQNKIVTIRIVGGVAASANAHLYPLYGT